MSRFIVVAVLAIRPGQEPAFAEFEKQALAIAAGHGGRLERALRPAPLREVHVLAFPSEAAFTAYRTDGRLAALAALRAEAIEETAIHAGTDVALDYAAGP